jgi:hypothetical protein
MSIFDEPPNHVGAHAAQANHAKLHSCFFLHEIVWGADIFKIQEQAITFIADDILSRYRAVAMGYSPHCLQQPKATVSSWKNL